MNATSKSVQVFWLSFEGERVHLATLLAGQSVGMNSFESYPFVLVDPQDVCLAVYTSCTGETRVFWTGK